MIICSDQTFCLKCFQHAFRGGVNAINLMVTFYKKYKTVTFFIDEVFSKCFFSSRSIFDFGQ